MRNLGIDKICSDPYQVMSDEHNIFEGLLPPLLRPIGRRGVGRIKNGFVNHSHCREISCEVNLLSIYCLPLVHFRFLLSSLIMGYLRWNFQILVLAGNVLMYSVGMWWGTFQFEIEEC